MPLDDPTRSEPPLVQRHDDGLPERLVRSFATRSNEVVTPLAWLKDHEAGSGSTSRRIRFDELVGWRFDDTAGDLVHDSGRFFAVRGLQVAGPGGWSQPILHQPEIGVLGILMTTFDGVLHALMQAKTEPGNPNVVQLSPTVQATRSNVAGAHGGRSVPYLEWFRGPRPGARTIVDSVESEVGGRFFHKVNRNVVVEVTGEVEVLPGFRWLPLGDIRDLLLLDNVVNMDSRSVLSCLPATDVGGRARHSDADVQSWLTRIRAEQDLRSALVPLASVDGWRRDSWAIRHHEERHFQVVAVSVTAPSREVGRWTQPMVEPVGDGLIATFVREIDGVPHYLVRAQVEQGLFGRVEIGPAVQCLPANYRDRTPPRFLHEARTVDSSRLRYEAHHADEGGRFFHAQSLYRVVAAFNSINVKYIKLYFNYIIY